MLRREGWTAATSRVRPDFVAGLLIACGLLAFVPNLAGYFLADDFVLLSWTRMSAAREVAGFFDPNVEWFYRPLVKVFYWAGQGLFGLRAAPFHLISLMLHGLNAFLVYRLVAGLRDQGSGIRDYEVLAGRWAHSRMWVVGLVTGLLFLLNSHSAETVSWIAAIGDLAGLFCILAALLLFRRFLWSGRGSLLAASVGVFAVGLLTRETVVMLPLLVVVYAVTIGGVLSSNKRGLKVRRLAIAVVLYGAVLLAYLAVVIVGRGGAVGFGRGGLTFRALNLDSILLGVMDYVHGLIPGGRVLAALSLDTLRTVVWVEALVLVALMGILLWRKQHLALFGLVWLLATPLLFVFFSGPTDRYFYLPSVGYALLVAGLVMWAARLRITNYELPSGKWAQRGRIAKATGAIVLAAILLTQARDLTVKESAWYAAGKVSGGVFNDVKQLVPNPGDTDFFYFVKLPPFMDGVPAFQNALPQGVQLVYGNSTLGAVAVTECGELQGAPNTIKKYILMFKGDGVREFAGEGDCP